MLFHIIDDCFVILREGGVFRQAKVYRRGAHIYAGLGTRFVRLMHRGGTSRPTMLWEDLTVHPEITIGFNECPTAASNLVQIEGKAA